MFMQQLAEVEENDREIADLMAQLDELKRLRKK